MRLAAIHPPRKKPKREIASYPYCEHEGVNRHDEGRATDSVRWYSRIKKSAIYFNVDDLCLQGITCPPERVARPAPCLGGQVMGATHYFSRAIRWDSSRST